MKALWVFFYELGKTCETFISQGLWTQQPDLIIIKHNTSLGKNEKSFHWSWSKPIEQIQIIFSKILYYCRYRHTLVKRTYWFTVVLRTLDDYTFCVKAVSIKWNLTRFSSLFILRFFLTQRYFSDSHSNRRIPVCSPRFKYRSNVRKKCNRMKFLPPTTTSISIQPFQISIYM